MFWRFGGYASLSSLDNMLDKPDMTLEELLDEQDLIQELKQHNSKLIEYLRDENVLKRLLEYVIAPKPESDDEGGPSSQSESHETGQASASPGRAKGKGKELSEEDQEKEEKDRTKFAYIASEILSSDVWSILEALVENQKHLRKFWEYLQTPPPLDPVSAGYFTKVNEMLLDKKTEEMIEFMRPMDWLIPSMLQHVDCPMVMDLLLKMISLEKAEGGQGIVDWLYSQNLIPILLSYMSPNHTSATQTSASDFIKAIITISANASQNEQSCIGPNDLTRQLVSEPCVKTLITDMLRGGNPLTAGVGIIIEVIRKNNSDYDPEVGVGIESVPSSRDPIYLGTLLRIFADHVPEFMDLILSTTHTVINSDGSSSIKKRELKAAFGETIEPLGFDRFKTCELMAELLHCSNMGLLNERGSAQYVKDRDTERDRLKKTANKLAHRASHNLTDITDDSTTYPDNQSSMAGSGKLEIQNASDEEFEDVTISDDMDDKKSRSKDEKRSSLRPSLNDEDDFVEESLLSPSARSEAIEKAVEEEIAFLPASAANFSDDPKTPTSPGLSKNFDKLTTTAKKTGAEKSHSRTASGFATVSPLSPKALSPHPEDQPAPLFANRPDRPQSPTKKEIAAQEQGMESLATSTDDGMEGTIIDDDESVRSAIMGNDMAFPPIETDLDGSPVVGDHLKIMFVDHRVVPTILDFFFRFPWNNFLHNVVYDVVQQVFNGPMDRGYNRTLAMDLFDTGRITERVIEGQKRSDEAQATRNMRLGYMGHLTLIAEEVVKFTERHPPELLSRSVLERVMHSEWIHYVEHTLAETRERDNAILGGVRPDVNVGPRQAVLNAVQAAGGFGGGASAALANAGLGGGVGSLDSIELGAAGSGTSSGGYGQSLLSGFGSSSDEEDEDVEDADEEERQGSGAGEDNDKTLGKGESSGPNTSLGSGDASSTPPNAAPPPPPLNIPPSRARRQLQARLNRRKLQNEAAAAGTTIEQLEGEARSISSRTNPEGPGATADGVWEDDDDGDEVESEVPDGQLPQGKSAAPEGGTKRRLSTTSVAKVRSAIEEDDDEGQA
ncbi:MAG: hypothetical protein M1814_006637 [Vezdaea aestivalis]|nr:MAG: hypothetical protein M1814_006637 [Vezdaea aestivalis]